MAVSNEDVDAARERVARLREQVAQEEAKRTTREADLNNELTLAQLTREERLLEAQLSDAKRANGTVTEAREATPLGVISEQVKAATVAAKAAEKGVAPALPAPENPDANNEKQEG